ncbi:UvrD-helicase domain-containing protein [Desulfovibrio ferrophilus]|uniref:UvrD/REP helicase n=1 Tax=Desulfovibrio ferrophilus TaxID=241368 RepID=A0A2Z6B2L6_9BACT|nr:UvrD-helicase domain-containing protein [Desulfovibrio ferrophilus]BBD09759.1 UvrD/REP helicase [Desulfovibrio ferrophilus]
MEIFRADLHIHSRFSRATSKKLNLRLLAAWARIKGLDVLATGDFTHPEWIAEIEEHLEPDGAGLYTLKDNRRLERETPFLDGYPLTGQTRFMLVTEISSIYKRHNKTRKVHNLVFMPSLDKAKSFNQRLEQVGNLKSDGRPILGLDSHDLLEMVLETDPQAFLVPAHIWTPWFSLFGSKSGFDSVEECYGDLAGEIFAMETGLSSDPEMNWMISALDRYRMISNSDAHSGEKLAREANLFSGEISYEGIYRALRGEALGHKFLGTLEFFPEEGKYHLDGHRNCGVVMEPQQTLSCGGLCPVCGKPLTVGVLHRIVELADREQPKQPADAPGFTSLIPLPEVVSEILGFGSGSKKVKAFYGRLIARFGSELAILQDIPLEDIAKVSTPLAEGIGRMRRGEVYRNPGFDGQYGSISVFSPQEQSEIKDGGSLIKMPAARPPMVRPLPGTGLKPEVRPLSLLSGTPISYNAPQQRAIDAGPGPVLVLAGPGTGKTQTLMGRIGRLLGERDSSRHILALTFTRRAAGELSKRLLDLRGENKALPRADTMHAMAYECWVDSYGEAPTVLSEEGARRVFAEATGLLGKPLKEAWQQVNLARERMQNPPGDLADHFHAYTKTKESWNQTDYTDLLNFWLEQIEAEIWANPYTHILVDEVQDLSVLQLRLIKALACKGGEGIFAIGDPNQSIYSFRGAAGDVQEKFRQWWPQLTTITLGENYRSAQEVLDVTAPLVPHSPKLKANRDVKADIRLFNAPDGAREAAWIGERIRELIGSTSHSLADNTTEGTLSPGDIAVLVRFKGLIPPLRTTLDRLGLPCSVPEAEAFWVEPRMTAILDAAGRTLGIVGAPEANADTLDIPERVLLKGPVGLAAYLQSNPPFDHLFWTSPQFKKFDKLYTELGGWPGLLNWVHLQSELDMVRAKAEKIQIMSLHAAKGLEFEAVFLPALEDGILPFAGSEFLSGKQAAPMADEHLAEERRLLYVGMTRAKSMLYLSHADKRDLYGRELLPTPTRYLLELPDETFAKTTLVGRKVRQEKQLDLLGGGD